MSECQDYYFNSLAQKALRRKPTTKRRAVLLGAGAILLRGEVIRGLTTAASVWTVAAIGLAVGGGLYMAAVAATIIILIILAGIKPLEERYKDKRYSCILHLQVKRGQMSIDLLQKTLGERTARVKQFVVQQSDSPDHDDVTIRLSRIQHKDVSQIVEQLRQLPCISEVREDKM